MRGSASMLDHPPIYQRPPVITSLDFSPDGSLLAVAGFHEVLLWKADGSELRGPPRRPERAHPKRALFARWHKARRLAADARRKWAKCKSGMWKNASCT